MSTIFQFLIVLFVEYQFLIVWELLFDPFLKKKKIDFNVFLIFSLTY